MLVYEFTGAYVVFVNSCLLLIVKREGTLHYKELFDMGPDFGSTV